MYEESLAKIAGRNLKKLIKKNSMTQEQTANLLMVDEKTVRRWIKDGIDRLSTLERIAKEFEVDTIDTFFSND